jgi:site-specific recombinase XerD
MNRARKRNKGLPRRVYEKNGAWYFYSATKIRDKTGKEKSWLRLAYVYEGESAMLQALAAILKDKKDLHGTMPFVCAEYKARKLKKYSDETKAQYGQYLEVIARDFEDFSAAQVTTRDWAEFLRNNFDDKPNTAQKYTALAKRLFKYVISELGIRQDNPIDQIDLGDYETQRRTVLPTHEQVRAIREAGMHSKERRDTGKRLPNPSGPMFQCLVDMTYLCWTRAVDVRMLKESQIDGDWIQLQPAKTMKSSGKAVDIFITPEIRAVIDRAREIKRGYKIKGKDSEHDLITPYLFPKRDGKPYKKNGLFAMWDRARDRIGIDKDSPPELRIQFRDLRALGATDALKMGEQKDDIRKRLVHTTTKTTDIYIKDIVPEQSKIDLKLPW